MALSISLVDPCSGETLPAAYARISAASLDVAAEQAAVTVMIYRDLTARTDERQPILVESYLWNATGSSSYIDADGHEVAGWPSFTQMFGSASTANTNIIQIAYGALKTSVAKYTTAMNV